MTLAFIITHKFGGFQIARWDPLSSRARLWTVGRGRCRLGGSGLSDPECFRLMLWSIEAVRYWQGHTEHVEGGEGSNERETKGREARERGERSREDLGEVEGFL